MSGSHLYINFNVLMNNAKKIQEIEKLNATYNAWFIFKINDLLLRLTIFPRYYMAL